MSATQLDKTSTSWEGSRAPNFKSVPPRVPTKTKMRNIKIKSALPPHPFKTNQDPPRPKKRNFVGMGGFPAERTKKCQAPIKLEQSVGAQNCGQKNYGHEALSAPKNFGGKESETGRIRFRSVRFQTLSSVSFLGLAEFRGANSVSSSRPIICVPKRTHQVFRRTHRVCPSGKTPRSPRHPSSRHPWPSGRFAKFLPWKESRFDS